MASLSADLDLWERRRATLDRRMKSLEGELFASTLNKVPRIGTLRQLITCLRVFANGEFAFFKDGFSKRKFNNLTISKNYPPEHEFRGVINQAFEDILILEHIARQRINRPDLSVTLDIADRLAWDALQPAIEANWVPKHTTVITYLQKAAQIRIIPYAPVALIGIPFSAVDEPLDLLAIPHEVGHYVYRRGEIGSKTIRGILNQVVPDKPKYAKDWLEEIFADVYGCRVGGPIMALDFQNLQLEFSLKRFRMNDGDHPSPILRPYIYTKVLYKSKDPWASTLENLWDARRTRREIGDAQLESAGSMSDFGRFKFDSNNMIPINATISEGSELSNNKSVERILNRIYESVFNKASQTIWQKAAWWHKNTQKQGKPERLNAQNEAGVMVALFDHFSSHFVSERGTRVNPVDLTVVPSDLPFMPSKTEQMFCNTEGIEDPSYFDAFLADWPALFFPDNPRPYLGANPDDVEWWVYDVLFRAGWNTFGNGAWLKGP